MTDLDSIIGYISNQGFSMAVAAYLLVFFNTTLEKLTKAIDDLRSTVGQLIGKGGTTGSQ